MYALNNKSFWQGAGLIGLILATRFNHFGSSVFLPDATLAVLFLGGILIRNRSWLVLAITAAFGMDFYALGFKGVSDYCMSLGYWGLIPTYAAVWGAGRWLAKREQPFAALPYAVVSWVAVSIAFVLSNAFWYSFSDKVNTLSISAFAQAVAKYYTPYAGYAMMYLGVAWLVVKFFENLSISHNTKQV